MPSLVIDPNALYPGRSVRIGDPRVGVVCQVQTALNALRCGPLAVDGVFGPVTEASVKLLQTRRGIDIDGIVGPATWSNLFNVPCITLKLPTELPRRAIQVAKAEVGTRETSPNRGPVVDTYLQSVGLDPAGNPPDGWSWCMAFVYYCFYVAAKEQATPNPLVRTAGVLDHWNHSDPLIRLPADVNPSEITPGSIFIIDHGHNRGHAGIVTVVAEGFLTTLEGNTNSTGSRNGDGVYMRTRSLAQINTGYLDYSRF